MEFRLNVSCTGHICNEGIFARLIVGGAHNSKEQLFSRVEHGFGEKSDGWTPPLLIATKYMQWILVHICQICPRLNVIYRECKCI